MPRAKKALPIAEKKWTLMFYFASDNPLAPAIVSQLKALKSAGYHHQANVVAYFDPEAVETPTHVFDVNAIEKLNSAETSDQIGFDIDDPFVRNLMLDKLWGDELDRKGKAIRDRVEQLFLKAGVKLDRPKPPDFGSDDPVDPDEPKRTGNPPPAKKKPMPSGPEKSLDRFLRFCAEEYPAQHYMLFILGHGQVVGDDVFLFDSHAASSSLTLKGLAKVLKRFKQRDNVRNANFELVSFHSCSMSSVEIASELEGTANFLLASQGTAYVGSWPYLSILIRVFNDLKTNRQTTVKEMIKRMFFYVRHNSTDFILAGYSFDLCLCELSRKRMKPVEVAIRELSKALRDGLDKNAPPMVKNCILLAHWKSQSFWQENYTDMYDFCQCLDDYCTEFGIGTGNLGAIQTAAQNVMDALKPEDHAHPNQLVVVSQFVGPDDQYSHGLSVFFPWKEPSHDRPIMAQYKDYIFQKKTRWREFLTTYFASTMRDTRNKEDGSQTQDEVKMLQEDMAAIMFGASGVGAGSGALDKNGPRDPLGEVGPRDPLGGTGPRDPMGGSCTCGSIKNFPHDTRKLEDRVKAAYEYDAGPTLLSVLDSEDVDFQ